MKDLFIISLLPPDRKLTPFSRRDLAKLEDLKSTDKQYKKRLIYWIYEDKLKRIFESYVKGLEVRCILINAGIIISNATFAFMQKWCHDPIEATRTHACQILSELLIERPEQEQVLSIYQFL